jgi:hypothetical protein
MRELSNLEIDNVSGAGLKVDGKCYVFDGAAAVGFFIGWAKQAIKDIWGSPDPWG